MDFLRCSWCELNESFAEPLFPHDHLDGQVPLTPCVRCCVGIHGECQPIAPWWCSCWHTDCWNRMESR